MCAKVVEKLSKSANVGTRVFGRAPKVQELARQMTAKDGSHGWCQGVPSVGASGRTRFSSLQRTLLATRSCNTSLNTPWSTESSSSHRPATGWHGLSAIGRRLRPFMARRRAGRDAWAREASPCRDAKPGSPQANPTSLSNLPSPNRPSVGWLAPWAQTTGEMTPVPRSKPSATWKRNDETHADQRDSTRRGSSRTRRWPKALRP